MMSDEIISLRTESVSAQSMRFDLAKFKLVTTAILGSLAVGVSRTVSTQKVPYVMGLIPLVCIYIDLIADAKQIQIMVIGSFLKRQETGVFAEYEKFCDQLRKTHKVFIDTYAFYYATQFLCLIISMLGLGQLLFKTNYDPTEVVIDIASGVIGFILSWFLHRRYLRRIAKL